jgi:hypothetical protein
VVKWLACLPLDTRDTGSKMAKAMDFLLAIKIRSTPCFRWELKLETPRGKILHHVKEPCVAQLRCYASKIQGHFSPPSCFIARCLWCYQRALVDESGVLQLRWGRTIHQKLPQCLGRFLRHHPIKVTSSSVKH